MVVGRGELRRYEGEIRFARVLAFARVTEIMRYMCVMWLI